MYIIDSLLRFLTSGDYNTHKGETPARYDLVLITLYGQVLLIMKLQVLTNSLVAAMLSDMH